MRTILFLLLLFVLSCGKSKKEMIDLDSFRNQGKKIDIFNLNKNKIFDVSKINKISSIVYHKYNSWSQSNYNSKNILYPVSINLNEPKKRKKGNFNEILNYKDKIITINKKSFLTVFDLNLKELKKYKIYNRKIYKNFNLNFNLGIENKKILVSDNLGNIFCFDVESLKLLWSKKLTVPFVSNIKVYKGNLYLINSNSKLFSININTGKINWSYETASKNLKSKSQSYQMAIYKDKLFFTNDYGEMYAIDLLKNDIIWSKNLATKIFIDKPLNISFSSLAIDDEGTIYFSTNHNKTYALDNNSGNIKWSNPIVLSGELFFNKNLLISYHQDKIIILNKLTGQILFNKKIINLEKKQDFSIVSMLLGKQKIYFFTDKNFNIEINYQNLSKPIITKNYKNYEKFIIVKNNLFFQTKNHIIKH